MSGGSPPTGSPRPAFKPGDLRQPTGLAGGDPELLEPSPIAPGPLLDVGGIGVDLIDLVGRRDARSVGVLGV